MASRADDFERSEIVANFLDEVSSYLPQIGASLDRLQQVPGDLAAVERAFRCTHTIAGSAALMGYPALAHLAHGMEETLGTVLDARSSLPVPTVALLRRSFGRLERLVQQIRLGKVGNSGNEDARLVAEDDADRASWRGGMTGALGAMPSSSSSRRQSSGAQAGGVADAPTQRAPAAQAGQRSNGQAAGGTVGGAGGTPSMDEMLRAFQTGSTGSANTAPGPTNRLAEVDTAAVPQWRAANGAGIPGGAQSQATTQSPTVPPSQPGAPISARSASGPNAAIDEMRTDTEIMRRHVAGLRDGIARVREAAQTMENERAELRAFLDGSQDALARLEEWSGRQMGLDLAGSPEAVRRYLPLSVIWVTTTRLKRLAGLLQTAGRDLASSEEQVDTALRELRASIEATAALVSGSPDSGFSATIAQFSWMPPAGTVGTVGTAGDPRIIDSMPSALDAERALGPGARAELERQVREELRRSLEDDVRDEIAASVRREAEARLRHELEIEVRRQFLATLNPGLGVGGAVEAAQTMAHMPIGERGPQAIQVTSEQSPEALEIFRDEAQEHLQTITAGIAQLERAPGNLAAMHPIRRAMHTLKGAAGMMGFGAIQTLAHASEDLLDRLADGAMAFSPDIMKLILDTSDALDQLISGQVKRPEDQQKLVRSLTDRYSALTGAPVSTPPPPTAAPISVKRSSHKPAAQAVVGAAGDDVDLSVRLQLSKLDDLVNLFGELLVTRATVEERVTRMNALVSDAVLAGERLRDIGSQLETRIEVTELPSGRPAGNPPDLTGVPTGRSGGSGGPGGRRPFARNSQGSHTRDFDELEMDRYTEFHRLSRGLSESVTDVVTLNQEMEALLREMQTAFVRENRLSSDFQDRLLKARLVPLQSLIPRLYRSVRATAMAEGKEVEFFVEGGDTEVDRKVIEEVEAPLLHLVRNAVSHGIEKPDARAKRRKPRAGKVTIAATYEGNQVVIAVRDDGAGIDPDKIRSTAVARGWIGRNAKLSDKEAINLLFQPGVTTAAAVTEQSGRGVGLDVVRDVVGHLRGSVEVDSHPGQGTTFTMKFPITLQIARTVLVRVGPQTVAIPMAVVEQIGRLDYYQRVPGQSALELRNGQYPVVHLASYLKVPQGRIDDRSPVLLVNTGTQRVAMLVDAIINQQELVRKPLGAHLRDVRGIAGAAVLGNGQVVLILELQDLFAGQPLVPVTLPEPGSTSGPPTPVPISMQPTAPLGPGALPLRTSLGPVRSQPTRTPPPARSGVASMPTRVEMPAAVARSYVLVVDDSPSVRRVVGGMFRANGWNVQVARDGVEALDLIAKERPAAVLLDIEMPRMDGYELMATLRSQEQYKTLPLIVLTSRAASKHQQRAMQLGADDYVVKPYQEHELLGTIARLVQARGR